MIYGIRAVMEAIEAGHHLEKVFVQKNLKGDLIRELRPMIHDCGAPVVTVPIERLHKFTRKNHQGVVAFQSPVQYHVLSNLVADSFEKGNVPFFVVLDRITDVRNFGAVARSADGTGVTGLVIPLRNGAQINADAMKTSAGALTTLPVCREANLAQSIEYLKASGVKVVAVTEKASDPIFDLDLSDPLALVMGSEEDGVSPELLRICDHLVQIPMQGKVASLNVSAASAMAFYEVLRQRRAGDK